MRATDSLHIFELFKEKVLFIRIFQDQKETVNQIKIENYIFIKYYIR